MSYFLKLLSAISSSLIIIVSGAFAQGTVTNHAFAIGKGAGVSGYTSLLCGAGQIAVGAAGSDPVCTTLTSAFDSLLCSTTGSIPIRGASTWGCQIARTTITASVTASNNDYSPAGYTTATGWLRLTSTGTWSITGIVAQTPGDMLLVTNVGTSNKVTLSNNSGSSSAANRMTLGNDVVLGPSQTQCLVYDSSSVWRPCSAANGFGGLLYINGFGALDNDGSYTIIRQGNGGNNGLIIGTSDPTTYHRNTTHIFQSNAAFPFVQIDTTGLQIFGSTSGSVLQTVPTIAGTSVWSWRATTDTVVGAATTDNLTNKTLTAATLATRLVKGIYIVGMSAATGMTVTGTTGETTLATVAVPGNSMGANGAIRVTAQWTKTGTAGTGEAKIKFGGTTFFDSGAAGATAISGRQQTEIHNRGATNSQIGTSISAGTGNWNLQSTTASVATALDTTSSQNVTFTCQLGNTGDTCELSSYTVELLVP